MSFSRKAALCSCLPLALLFFILSPIHAAELTLEAEVGFHGLFQLGYPFPLRVELNNLGRPVEGTVEVKVWKGGPSRGVNAYPFYYRREIFLSAQSRKSISFTIDPDSVSRPLTVSFSGLREKLSKEIDLRRHFSPSPLILLLTENNAFLPIPLTPASPSPLVSLSLAGLPSDARAYQGVSTIIVYEQSLRDLSRLQTMALDTWLSSGGRMLILGSMYYALYQEPTISRFLPVRVVGLKRFSSLPSLERSYGEKAAPLRNLLVQDSRLVAGKVLLQEQNTPILVEMNRGKGKVFYLSLDVGRPPLSRWNGLSLLLKDLLAPSPGTGRSLLETSWDDAVFSHLLSNPFFVSTYVPARALSLWLFFYLGALGLLGWLWLRQRLPRRTLVIAFFSLVVCSSFGGYLYFDRGLDTPDGVLLTSTLLESQPDGYVEAQSNVALFSTRRRYYNLQVESGWSDLEPVLSRIGTDNDAAVAVQDEGSSTRFQVPLMEWNYRLFKIRSVSRFPLHTEIQNQGDRLVLRVRNLTPRDLTECWLVVAGQRFFLGDILQGSAQTWEFSLSPERPSSSQPNSMALREIAFNNKIREDLFRYSFFPQDRGAAHWGSGAVLLFGWVQGVPRRVWIDDRRVLAHDYALFRAIIPQEEWD